VNARWSGSASRGPLTFELTDAKAVAPGSPAVFVDRDGTINEAVRDPESGMPESPLRVEDVRLLPGVAPALDALSAAGFALVCVSNQPAAAKAKVSAEELLLVHEAVIERLAQHDVRVATSRLCLHHPEGSVGCLSWSCGCRKPAPGMLLAAAADLRLNLARSWMLGDTDSDVAAGRAAGCRTVLLEYPGSAHKRPGGTGADLIAGDIGEGVEQLLRRRR
jgi:D-glycero-D-manno-heptose 1,7-bisphosphate phosphatase